MCSTRRRSNKLSVSFFSVFCLPFTCKSTEINRDSNNDTLLCHARKKFARRVLISYIIVRNGFQFPKKAANIVISSSISLGKECYPVWIKAKELRLNKELIWLTCFVWHSVYILCSIITLHLFVDHSNFLSIHYFPQIFL